MEDKEVARLNQRSKELIQQTQELIEKSQAVIDQSRVKKPADEMDETQKISSNQP